MPVEALLHDPWRGFLEQLDVELSGPTELHCFGGFVVAECYGLTRATSDVDFVEVCGSVDVKELLRLAGKTSALAGKHKVYLDFVAVATIPEHYDQRLIDAFPRAFRHLRLRIFEPHDLALAKLERNQDHDREDVKGLALNPGLIVDVLRRRYEDEMRWKLGNPEREDLTLQLWIEMIQEVQSTARR